MLLFSLCTVLSGCAVLTKPDVTKQPVLMPMAPPVGPSRRLVQQITAQWPDRKAVNAVFGAELAVSSSKGMTGHTLGTTAALELAFCWLLLNRDDEQGALIPNINEDERDSELAPLNLVKKGMVLGRKINTCQSNSFAFGGNNLSIVISRA